MACASVCGDGPGTGLTTFGAVGIGGTSAPPKLAVCGAAELLTNVTWSPDFSFRGVGENASTSVCAVEMPISTLYVVEPSEFFVCLGVAFTSFFLAASPSARYFFVCAFPALVIACWESWVSAVTCSLPIMFGCNTQ